MTARERQADKPVFTLLPPHYHNDWAYEQLIKELREKGYKAHAPHLEISDPAATRDDHAAVMEKTETKIGAEKYIRVGASWGGDLIYRQLGERVSKLVFLGAPLRPVIDHLNVTSIKNNLANDPSLEYAAYVAGEKEFNRRELGRIFYKNLGNLALKAWATSKLEPHPHEPYSGEDDQNAVLPLPHQHDMHYVGFLDDRIISFDKQAHTARFFRMKFTPFPSGHFPMLEKPELLAKLLVQIAEDEVDQKSWLLVQRKNQQRRLLGSYSVSGAEQYYEL